MVDLSREMGQVKTAMENFKESNDQAHERMEAKQDITNTRLGSLEKWRERIIGAGVLLGLTLPLFALPVREAIGKLLE